MHRTRTPRPALGISATFLGATLLLVFGARAARAAEPVPPASARLLPARNLTFYIEYEGLDAHAQAWSATAASAWFNKTPTGAMIGDLARQILDRVLKESPGLELTGADVVALYDHMIRKGFAVALYDEGGGAASMAVILKGFGRQDVRTRFGRIAQVVLKASGAALPAPRRLRGRDLYEFKDVRGLTFPGSAGAGPVVGPALPVGAVPAEIPTPPGPAALPPEATLPGPPAAPNFPSVPGSNDDPNRVDRDKPSTEGQGVALGRTPDAPPPPPLRTSQPAGAPPEPPPDPEAQRAEPPAGAPPAPEPGPPSAGEPPALPSPSSPHLVGASPLGGANPPSGWTVWLEGDDLVAVSAVADEPAADALKDAKTHRPSDRLAAVFDAIERRQPDATTHPGYRSARAEGSDLPGFEPNGLFFVESGKGRGILKTIVADLGPDAQDGAGEDEPVPNATPKPAADPAASLGLDGLVRLVGRWGFQGKALLTDVRIEAPAPRKGLVSLFDQPTFRTDQLPPIPRGAGSFTLATLDARKSYDAFAAVAKSLGPEVFAIFDAIRQQAEGAVLAATGQRLRDDLLAHLGPTWCVYAAPSDHDAADESATPTLLVGVDDAEAFAKVLDAVAERLAKYLREQQGLGQGADQKGDDPPAIAIERLPAPLRGYRLTSPAKVVMWLAGKVEPTVLLGKSHLVVAMNPKLARAAIAAESRQEDRWRTEGELADALKSLPASVSFLSIGNPRDSSWPETTAELPRTIQWLANTLDVYARGASDKPSAGDALALFGVPRPGAFRVRIDPARRPKADELRALLFPSVLAATPDERGYRILLREALPLACVPAEPSISNELGTAAKSKPVEPKIGLKLKYHAGESSARRR